MGCVGLDAGPSLNLDLEVEVEEWGLMRCCAGWACLTFELDLGGTLLIRFYPRARVAPLTSLLELNF